MTITGTEASSGKTHHVQLRRAEGHEVWRGDRLIGLRDWVMEYLLIVFMTLLYVPIHIPFGPDTKRNGRGGGGGGGVMYISGPMQKAGGTVSWPSDIAALAIHIRKGGVSITVDTYSVQERLYVLEYRSPTEGGKGGGGDNFCGRGTISASGLRPWGTISASRLCPGGQNLRGDRICSDTGGASK